MVATASTVDPTNFRLSLNWETVEAIPYEKMIPRGLVTNLALHELGGFQHCHLEKSWIHQENQNLWMGALDHLRCLNIPEISTCCCTRLANLIQTTWITPRLLQCPRKPALSERYMKDPKFHGNIVPNSAISIHLTIVHVSIVLQSSLCGLLQIGAVSFDLLYWPVVSSWRRNSLDRFPLVLSAW